MRYQPVDRVPVYATGGWPETHERWISEGWDPDTFDITCGADKRHWFSQWFFPHPPFEHKVIAEDDMHITYVNHEGILMRERKDQPFSSMPQFIKFPVVNREEFRSFWQERMQPNLTERIGPDWQNQLKAWRAEPIPMIVMSDRWGGFFGPLRNMVGVETLCQLFYDDPAFVEEMMDANADMIIAIMDQILDVVVPDVYIFWEDMAYKTAPLISPALVRKYMYPRYRRVVDFVRGRGVEFVGLDSDGFSEPLIPIWLDAGINIAYPFEVQANMDVNRARKLFGRDLLMWGGVDKRALAEGPAAIDAELERVRPAIESGGYIPYTDHSEPPDISFANHCYYMEKLREVCGG